MSPPVTPPSPASNNGQPAPAAHVAVPIARIVLLILNIPALVALTIAIITQPAGAAATGPQDAPTSTWTAQPVYTTAPAPTLTPQATATHTPRPSTPPRANPTATATAAPSPTAPPRPMPTATSQPTPNPGGG